MAQFPVEVWAEILRLAWPIGREEWTLNTAFHHATELCTVNRMFNQTLTPLFYRQCELYRLATLQIFLATLLSNPSNSAHVRCLTILIQFESDTELEEMATLVSGILENLPKLVFMEIQPILGRRNEVGKFLCPDPHQSTDFTSVAFSSPTRFPFQLRLFSTTLAYSIQLGEFISTQTSLYAIHWMDPHSCHGEGRVPAIPSHVISQAFTGFLTWEDLVESVPKFLNGAPNTQHVFLDLNADELWPEEGLEMDELVALSVWPQLKSLTLVGEWEYEAELCQTLTALAPRLTSIRFLKLIASETHSIDFLQEAAEILRQMPHLEAFVFEMGCEFPELEEWLSTSPDLPPRLQIYTSLGFDNGKRQQHIVRIQRSPQGIWTYESTDLSMFPICRGSGVAWSSHPNVDMEHTINAWRDWTGINARPRFILQV